MKRYGRKSGKRWSAKARRDAGKAIRRGASAALCKQCRVLRLIRGAVYDGPMAVTHGRCSTCGRFIVQPDFAAHWRRVFTYCGPEEPKHWLDRCSQQGLMWLTRSITKPETFA